MGNSLENMTTEISNDITVNLKRKNKAITKHMFELKETTALVSACFGITSHAIYKYNREFIS